MKAASIPTSTGEPAPGDVARAALSSIRGIYIYIYIDIDRYIDI